MKATQQRILILPIVIFVLTISLFNTGTVLADDVVPPVEPVGTEEPVATIETALMEEPGAEEIGVQEILELVPEGIEVIVLNQDGRPEPLATEEEAEIIITSDPIWCMDGVAPDPTDPNCSPSFASMTELISWLTVYDPNAAGTIWIEDSYDSGSNFLDNGLNFALYGLTLTNMANNSLTIQGGWNGIVDDTTITGSSEFNGYLQIVNWNGNITLNNIIVDGAVGDGVSIYYANGDIQLTNVSSNNNSNDGFYIESNGEINAANVVANDNGFAGAALSGGDGVTLNGTNNFNDNGASYGLGVFSYTDIVLNNITANSNGIGVYIDNTAGSGDVALNGSNVFNGNLEGLWIFSNGDVTANNIEAINNAGNGAYIDNNLFGGNGSVVISGTNVFNTNGNYGLIVHSSEDITASNITASNNIDYGMYLDNCNDDGLACTGSGDVIISGINIFNGNGGGGANVVSNGNITVENVMANENDMSGISLTGYGSSVTVSSSVFNSNSDYGIDANYSTGDLTLSSVSFDCLNGLGDYYYNDTISYACPPEKSDSASSDFALHTVSAGNEEYIELDCTQYTGTMLMLDNGSHATFKCPITGFASLSMIEEATLPAALPEGIEYVSGLNAVSSPVGSDQVLGGQVIISFAIPQNMNAEDFAVLYWDGSEWVNLKDATFEDGREVFSAGFNTGDGYFQVVTNFSGKFVLVTK